MFALGSYVLGSYILSLNHDFNDYEVKNENLKGGELNEEKMNIEESSSEVILEVSNDSFNYLANLVIPKINLRKHLYPLNSKENTVDKNIEVIAGSSMPDEDFGNLILAGHNGNTSVGYFRRLHELSLDDEIIVNYNNKNYVYEVAKIYDVLKTGKVAILRDKSKRAITLITCFGIDRQLVVIGYLKE